MPHHPGMSPFRGVPGADQDRGTIGFPTPGSGRAAAGAKTTSTPGSVPKPPAMKPVLTDEDVQLAKKYNEKFMVDVVKAAVNALKAQLSSGELSPGALSPIGPVFQRAVRGAIADAALSVAGAAMNLGGKTRGVKDLDTLASRVHAAKPDVKAAYKTPSGKSVSPPGGIGPSKELVAFLTTTLSTSAELSALASEIGKNSAELLKKKRERERALKERSKESASSTELVDTASAAVWERYVQRYEKSVKAILYTWFTSSAEEVAKSRSWLDKLAALVFPEDVQKQRAQYPDWFDRKGEGLKDNYGWGNPLSGGIPPTIAQALGSRSAFVEQNPTPERQAVAAYGNPKVQGNPYFLPLAYGAAYHSLQDLPTLAPELSGPDKAVMVQAVWAKMAGQPYPRTEDEYSALDLAMFPKAGGAGNDPEKQHQVETAADLLEKTTSAGVQGMPPYVKAMYMLLYEQGTGKPTPPKTKKKKSKPTGPMLPWGD